MFSTMDALRDGIVAGPQDLASRRALLLRRRKRSWWRVAGLSVLTAVSVAWLLLVAVEMLQQV